MFLFLDFETYSSIDISNGIRKYISSDDFDVICGVFKLVDRNGCVVHKDVHTEKSSSYLIEEMIKETKYVVAHNIEFDLEVYSRFLVPKYGYQPFPSTIQFICTKKRQSFLNQPASLKEASKFHRLSNQKLDKGKNLIEILSKPGKKNGNRTRDSEKEAEMLEYCLQDVDTLIELFFSQMEFYKSFNIQNNDYLIQNLDLKINRTGFPVNVALAKKLSDVADEQRARSQLDACKLVGDFDLPGLSQTLAIKNYIKTNLGYDVESFDYKKQTHENAPEIVKKLLSLRDICNKNSVSKSRVAVDSSVDGRLFNQLNYSHAHTGRWAGRGFQPQNLPSTKNENDPSSFIRNIISCGSTTTFIVMDYSSIEHRALFYLAREFMKTYNLKCIDVDSHYSKFFTGDDAYCELAEKIYNLPKNSVNKSSLERKVGKTAHLGLGYGMGPYKFKTTAEHQSLIFTDVEAEKIVSVYRETYPIIPKMWYFLLNQFIDSVESQEEVDIQLFAGVKLVYKPKTKFGKNCLSLKLPNGRPIFYYDLKVEKNSYTKKYSNCDFIEEQGNSLTIGESNSHKSLKKSLKIGNFFVHGGELIENLVQGFCRDLLADHMLLLDSQLENARIVFHVHDEIVVESYDGFLSENIRKVEGLKNEVPTWCAGFPIDTEIYLSKFYRK